MSGIKKIILLLFLFPGFVFSQNRQHDSLNSLVNNEKNDTSKVRLLNKIGWSLRRTDRAKAREYYDRAFELSTDKNFYNGIHESLIKTAKLQFISGNFQSAIDSFLNKAIELARRNNRNDFLSEALCVKGDALVSLGELPSALVVSQEALKIFESQKNETGISIIKITIGNIYFPMRKYNAALKSYKESYGIKVKLKDEFGQATCLVNMLAFASVVKDHKNAIIYAKEAERLSLKNHNDQYLPVIYQNLSNTFVNLRLSDSALVYYDKAIKIAERSNNLSSLSGAYVGKANTYIQMKKFKEALANAKVSLDIGKKSNDRLILEEVFDVMGRSHFHLGNFKEAYLFNKLHDSLKSVIINSESSKQIEELNVKYESVKKDGELQKKESEIKLQQNENQQRSRERNGFIIGFIIMIILAIFIFRSLQQNRKANKIITVQKELVEQKNHIIEEKQKEILDSIHYAKRIQKALMPNDKFLEKEFKRFKK